MLDKMSVREQRKIVQDRMEQILSHKNNQVFHNEVPLTRPIDTDVNALIYKQKQEK